MDIILVFFIISVSVAASSWLGWVAGHRKGVQQERRRNAQAMKAVLNSAYGRFPERPRTLPELIEEHNERMGL